MSYLHPAHDPRRSRSRRRRSSASDHEVAWLKVRRTGEHTDVSPFRRTLERDELCTQCRSFDIERIIETHQHIPSSQGHFIAYLELGSDSACKFCRFLMTMQIAVPLRGSKRLDEKQKAPQEQGYHLRAFSATSSFQEFFLRPPNRKTPQSGDTMLAVVPNGLFSDKESHKSYSDTFSTVGYILPVAYSSRAPWLTGRRLHPSRVNFPLVQEWLHFCHKKHSCAMRYSRPAKLKIIDCKTMEIVTAPPNCNYFALSYVWGKPSAATEGLTPSLLEPHSTPEVLRNAAPVVRDAIQIVKNLGKRYLWVDKYCIPQEDAEMKTKQIKQMDLIYEGAYCTIVVAAGENDAYGIPGLSRPRLVQPSCSIGNTEYVSTLPDPQMEIRRSVWMTRAWTYQEAFCSARRLIFTDHQVYFECKTMHSCEAVEIPLNVLHSPDYKALRDHVRPVLFRDEWQQGTHRFGPISAFWSSVKLYSKRRMTYDADSLNALEGILRRFQSSPSFVYNIFGIPLHTQNREDKGHLLESSLFVRGLSWSHSESPRRRNGFPSWSWAGWEGVVEQQRLFGSTRYDSKVNLWVQQRDGERLSWQAFWDEFWTSEGKMACLQKFGCVVMEADMFKVQLIRRDSLKTDRQAYVDMVNPYDQSKYATILLPQHLLHSSRVATDLWDCMVLGRKGKVGGHDVMLIQWDVDTAERVWAGTLFTHGHRHGPLTACLPPLLRRKFKLK